MPILSLDSLPWILLAIVVGRSVVTAGRLAVMREELAQTRERLGSALAALEQGMPRTAGSSPVASREELEAAARAALEVVRRESPQLAENFTKVS